MAGKYLVILAVTTSVVKAGVVPVAGPPVIKVDTHDPYPQYTYAYNVEDSITGDAKSHHETRNGDIVTGSYSLIEADGSRRVVEYTADPINGFNAVVHKEPLVYNAVPAVAKVASTYVATPAIAYHH